MSLNPPIKSWQGLRLWVVGASSGIGQALAHALLAAGAEVILSSRQALPLQELAQRYPQQALALPLDVCDAAAWQPAYMAIIAWRGAPDYLIFCAADYQPVRAWSLDPAAASRMIDINIKGAIQAVACVLPAMLENGTGGIALTASVAGYMGMPKSLTYGPTKAALINFAEALYVDVHQRGIAVHVINPGFVATPLTAGNDFNMPALITAKVAAQEIMAGLARGEFEIHFPKRFTRSVKLLRALPYWLKFRILQKIGALA